MRLNGIKITNMGVNLI